MMNEMICYLKPQIRVNMAVGDVVVLYAANR